MQSHDLLATLGLGLLGLLAGTCRAQETVLLEDFEQPLGERWTFHNGSEFPGATGSFERSPEAAHDGEAGGRLAFDFTGGGAYVQATVQLPKDGPPLGAVELWVRKPVANQLTARCVDEQGQTFQKSFNVATRGWQRLRVRLDGWTFSWGGHGDGVFHGRPTAFALLVERGEATTGVVDLDDLVGLPRTEGGIAGVYAPEYTVTTFGATGRQVSYDFAGGARDQGLYWDDASLLGRPQSLRLRVHSDGSGHEVRMTLYSHFQSFERSLGTLDGVGEMTLEAPLGSLNEWTHSGGEDDGVARLPLRLGRIMLVRREGGPDRGEVELQQLSVRTEVPSGNAVFPLARVTEPEPGRLQFELTACSLAPTDLDTEVQVRVRDFAGRTINEPRLALRLPPGGQPVTATVDQPAQNLPFVEAQFTVTAPDQQPQRAVAAWVAPWADPGSAELQPDSPWGMGVYLYRYDNDPAGLAAMDRAAALAEAAGIKWSREEFGWAGIEPQRGQFQWDHYDAVVETALRHGISVYGLIDYWSPWTQPFTEAGIADYCRYAQALVRRYGDRIKHWEIWNEPNIFFWSGPKDVYFQLLDQAYAAIKEADPEAVVFGCSTAGIDTSFIRQTLEAGSRFDGLTIHPYRGSLADAPFVQELGDTADLVAQNGRRRPVWITEMGWSTQVGGTPEREQAGLLARCYLDAVASGAVQNISWYDFRNDGTNPDYNEHHMGVIRNDFTLKPAYRAAATVCRRLAGLRPVGFEEWDGGVVACRFAGEVGETLALWSLPSGCLLRLDEAPAGLRALNLMGEPIEPARDGHAALLYLPPGTPVLISSPVAGLRGRGELLGVRLDDPGLRAGGRAQVSLEIGALVTDRLQVAWQLPPGWTIRGLQPGRFELSVPADAAPGPYEVAAVASTDQGEIVLPATVEVVPEVLEV